jgi:uncharacterized repeat protein (TIGR01451 family)
MSRVHRLAQQASAVALTSVLVAGHLRAAIPNSREVAERFSKRKPLDLADVRRRFLEANGEELAPWIARRAERRERKAVGGRSAPARGPATVPRGRLRAAPDYFHADGLSTIEPRPVNPLLDPLGFFEDEAGEEPPTSFLTRLFLADFDGDGDLDAFVGDKYGYVRYLRNDGGLGNDPVYVELTGAASPTGSLDLSRDGDGSSPFGPSAPALVDIDDDDDLDLFVGQGFDDRSVSAGGRVLFFENDGGVLTRNDVENPLAGFVFGLSGATPTFVDVDGDEDFDAFVGTKADSYAPDGGEVFFLRNDGDENSPSFVDQTDVPGSDPFAGVTFQPLTAPHFADVDGDDDLDAFVGNFYWTRFFRNETVLPGTPVFPEETGYSNPLAGGLVGAPGPVLADVDGDGDLDAFVTGGWYYSKVAYYVGVVQYFENTGTPADSSFLSTGDRIELVDVDGDEDLDALVSSLGTPSVEEELRGLEPSSATLTAAPGEGTADPALPGVWYFRNLGTDAEPVWELQSLADNPFFTFNSSGLPGFGGSFFIPSFAPTVGDLDGDSLLDAFVGLPDGKLEFLEDDGTGQLDPAASHPLESVDFGESADPQLAHVNGDGELDLVVGYDYYDPVDEVLESRVAFFLNPTGAAGLDAPPDIVLDFTGQIARPAPTLADVDGDGDMDLLVGGFYYYEDCECGPFAYGYSLTLFVENTGTAMAPAFDAGTAVPVEALVQGPTGPAMGDVNGDLALDLFIGNPGGVEMFLTAVPDLEVTKAVTGGDLLPGGTVEYTIMLENVGTGTIEDLASDELVDVLPAELALTGATVTSGPGAAGANVLTNTVTWNGAILPGETVTILVTADVASGTDGQTIVNQAMGSFDSDGDMTADTNEPSDDPTTALEDDPTAFTVGVVPQLEVTKEITGGDLAAGGTVEYTVTIENVGSGEQPDDPEDPELTDTLPPSLSVLSATVTSGPGTASIDMGTNSVRYDGAILAGASVEIVITAAIDPAAEGSLVENQAFGLFDADLDGDNETSEPSNDPATEPDDDPTAFLAGASASILEIPALSGVGSMLLGLLLSLAGLFGIRRIGS